MQHNLRNFGIKLRTGVLKNFLTDNELRHGVAIASVRSHGIIGIRHGNNPCNLRNFIAFQPFRITRSVIFFMMIVCADA